MPSPPALTRAVRQLERKAGRLDDPYARAIELGALVAFLQEHVREVTAERDAALLEVMDAVPRPSNRQIARELGLSRQRVDQLSDHAARGGRPRRGRGRR